MEDWIEKLLAKWTLEGVKLNPPASIADIERLEVFLEFSFPSDFKDFYLHANGFADLAWQEHMFTFWPLEMIKDEFERENDKNFIGFCDFLIASHMIGFLRNKPGIYKHYEYHPSIAQSFQDVVEMINNSDDRVY